MLRTTLSLQCFFALILLALIAYSGCSASVRSSSPGASYASAPSGDSAPAPSSAPRPSAAREAAGADPSPRAPSDGIRKRDTPPRARRLEPAPPMQQQSNAGRMTAGEWRDLDQWGFWQELTADRGGYKHLTTQWGYFPQGMIPVVVHNRSTPVADVAVTLEDAQGNVYWTARTDNKGRAYLFQNLFSADRSQTPNIRRTSHQNAQPAPRGGLFVRTWGQSNAVRVQPNRILDQPISLEVPRPANPVNRVADVMFVVDTTGSMGDELSYLQNELKDVIQRAQAASKHTLTVRTSVNFYRDRNDAYLVRSNPFHTDLNRVIREIDRESAGGGGDYPEAVDEALEDAITNHTWSRNAAARILFLILDAPPHSSREDIQRLHEVTVQAAKRGIRIVPVAASGINKPTEFLMRSLAISTGGTYTFITDHSGIGNSHLKPTVGPHQIEQLNTMLARIIYESSRRFDDPQLQWSMLQ